MELTKTARPPLSGPRRRLLTPIQIAPLPQDLGCAEAFLQALDPEDFSRRTTMLSKLVQLERRLGEEEAVRPGSVIFFANEKAWTSKELKDAREMGYFHGDISRVMKLMTDEEARRARCAPNKNPCPCHLSSPAACAAPAPRRSPRLPKRRKRRLMRLCALATAGCAPTPSRLQLYILPRTEQPRRRPN